MQAYHFDVYDIDGTLTIPDHDLWYLSTRSLSADKDLFDSYVAEWKSEIQSGMDPFECSLTMGMTRWATTESYWRLLVMPMSSKMKKIAI